MNKCMLNFDTSIAYDKKGKEITINKYINKYIDKQKSIFCENNHELIFVNGEKKKAYFKHKNSCDIVSDMTIWHNEWQNNFKKTEICFPKINEEQISERRADVLISKHNIILEIQHSQIDKDEVDARKHDYELNNKRIYWLLHGNDTIKIHNLETVNRTILEFISEPWKYESFENFDYIFIDIDDLIYKIYPKYVKSRMIDVDNPMSKEQFIKNIKKNKEILYNIDLPVQSTMYLKQQGAGNGKTFGLIQMLDSKEFEQYNAFIIVTKQHSAKTIILNEFKEQLNKGYLKNIETITKMDSNKEGEEEYKKGKKYKIEYINTKTNSKCKLIIATMDSLMYSLGNKMENSDLNKFTSLINSIINDFIPDTISISGIQKLNKKTCLICDETQDLSENYAKAIYRLMRNYYIDSYIVGDKLQSIMFTDNAFTYLSNNDLPYINKKIQDSTNICRRFTNQYLVDFVNNAVDFNKFNLPTIKPYNSENTNLKEELIIFEGKTIYNEDDDEIEDIINDEIETILKHYMYEVEKKNRNPEDFLIVTPFTRNNPLCDALETSINMYWNNKNNNNKYKNYAIFHKSDEGTSINLEESDKSTRIVSIHTSKGDGRKVVFVIGLDEQSLLKFSKECNNLLYESLLHVAITRMKETLYFRYIKNNDDVHNKIIKAAKELNINVQEKIKISNFVKYNTIVDNLKNYDDYEKIKKYLLIDENIFEDEIQEKNKKVIDMENHLIRYVSMSLLLQIKIISHENNNINKEIKRQLMAKYLSAKRTIIKETNTWIEHYNILKEHSKKKRLLNKNPNYNHENLRYISILQISKKGKDYIKLYEILLDFCKNVKRKIQEIVDNNENNYQLCPLECIILHYILEFEYGFNTTLTIIELYNIINSYSKCFTYDLVGHDNCLCKEKFNNTQTITNKLQQDLVNHYQLLSNIGLIYDNFLQKYSKVNWLKNHTIFYSGTTSDIYLSKRYDMLGYDNDTVYIISIKPQFNDLNKEEFKFDILFDTLLIHNIENNNMDNENKNKERFSNKLVKIIVFTLDKNNYIVIDYNQQVKENNDELLKYIQNKIIDKYIVESKLLFVKYLRYVQEFQKDKPQKIINKIIEKIKNKDTPDFFVDIFKRIEFQIEDEINIAKQQEILNKYKNEELFQNHVKINIERAIIRFMGLEK